MPFTIQTFAWLSDDVDGGRREITPRLHDSQITWVGDSADPHFQIHLECKDEVIADAWSIGDEVAIEFTLDGYGGIAEGTAEITNYKTSLDGPADHRICTLHLEPGESNMDTDKFPAALQTATSKE